MEYSCQIVCTKLPGKKEGLVIVFVLWAHINKNIYPFLLTFHGLQFTPCSILRYTVQDPKQRLCETQQVTEAVETEVNQMPSKFHDLQRNGHFLLNKNWHLLLKSPFLSATLLIFLTLRGNDTTELHSTHF